MARGVAAKAKSRDSIGNRVTFGVIAPSTNTSVQPEFDAFRPHGVTNHHSRCIIPDTHVADDKGFMVMLNINLALLNLMPLPVLDGGHITMALYELILRRRVSVRFQEYATTVFAVLLLSFMAYVSFFDVRRLPLFLQMFKQKPIIEESAAKPAPVVTPRPAQ